MAARPFGKWVKSMILTERKGWCVGKLSDERCPHPQNHLRQETMEISRKNDPPSSLGYLEALVGAIPAQGVAAF